MSMSHAEFRSRMLEYLSGRMPREQEALFREHERNCADCAARLAEEQTLWDLLGSDDPDSLDVGRSVWPEVRRRTFGAKAESAWFFGQGRFSRLGLAASALAAGLAWGWLLPGWIGSATSVTGYADTDSYEVQSNWLDDSSAYDLAGLWLDMGSEEESDGS